MRVEGLDEFRAALRVAYAQYPEAARRANFEIAQTIAARARVRAGARGGVARKAAVSLRAYRTATGGVLTAGGARAPYFWGAEFGAKRYRRFDTWRGNQWRGWAGGPGYFLHPTIRDEARNLLHRYVQSLDADVHRRPFRD
jgi:hypothetical protein